ncbi:cell shape determination protein CcmA [Candidatus Falkowbacteria bacterium CG10_big_fil_rev_8_21_14_0_10_43_11]|uniref:Cell shape determination protein CcmA n=1 Tax=Candidatus Falkowbacteria bacterium CG10_big_fil_rev_8_21_14_0_10_43_11 TaxID=1974568 RepID=A0A2M6WLI7_9BACT|nr:MAG: cell shape determination protein CcmA [Candidatus Falkowbacteria bacterium CG10_big_fil_rev_8_21_14_0_10_43_11]
MFKKQEDANFKEAETIIGPSVKVEGDFIGQGNIIVDGVIKGSIATNGNLRVGDQAKITANVAAANGLISGEIHGNVKIAGDLELTENAKIFGDIEAKSICIARGAIFSGQCSMANGEISKKTNGTKKDAETTNEKDF